MNHTKYYVDVFTEEYMHTVFPENSYEASTDEELLEIIKNCMADKAGIAKIEIVNTSQCMKELATIM